LRAEGHRSLRKNKQKQRRDCMWNQSPNLAPWLPKLK
jgi:hypothetical protein